MKTMGAVRLCAVLAVASVAGALLVHNQGSSTQASTPIPSATIEPSGIPAIAVPVSPHPWVIDYTWNLLSPNSPLISADQVKGYANSKKPPAEFAISRKPIRVDSITLETADQVKQIPGLASFTKSGGYPLYVVRVTGKFTLGGPAGFANTAQHAYDIIDAKTGNLLTTGFDP